MFYRGLIASALVVNCLSTPLLDDDPEHLVVTSSPVNSGGDTITSVGEDILVGVSADLLADSGDDNLLTHPPKYRTDTIGVVQRDVIYGSTADDSFNGSGLKSAYDSDLIIGNGGCNDTISEGTAWDWLLWLEHIECPSEPLEDRCPL